VLLYGGDQNGTWAFRLLHAWTGGVGLNKENREEILSKTEHRQWEGLICGKKKEGPKAKLPFFLLSTETGEGGGQRRSAGGGRQPSPARWRPGSRGTERGGRGRLVPVLTSGRGGLWREIDGGGRSVIGAA
jgi:hypothetical protein